MMPLVWDLGEANIKRKGQFLLPWRNLLFLVSVSCTAHQSFEHAATPVALRNAFALVAIVLTTMLIAPCTSIKRCREL